ncbi:peptidase M28 family protein [Saccharobesus litoralis]|uniref:Carboxypeptidase Q n=1 Tax=Saccharobesus litoralis TaxID=2172099 RepID=A0A2S0VWE9_9ALTE|nr:M28 family peptidase [Saccharobesus litoralis]AWB68547.1 peptidase M28 family protein [Saccharobesus litoralis]
MIALVRNITFVLFIITLSLFSSLSKANEITSQTLSTLQEKALTSTLAYDLADSLTTEVGARLAGSEGDKKAVVWAEQKMQSLGFDKIAKQAVPVRAWQRGTIRAHVTSPFSHQLAAVALGGSVPTPINGLSAELITFKGIEQLQAAPKENIVGKIVYLSQAITKNKDAASYGKAIRNRSYGAIEAAKKGAKALLIRSMGTAKSRYAHTGAVYYQKNLQKIPAAAISTVDAELLRKLEKYEKPITISLNIQTNEKTWQTSYNVIGDIIGSEKPNEIVLLAAHLDSWDLGTGAIDNASGVGAVLSAANLVKQLGQPKRTLRVVLFASEEMGLRGAKTYLKEYENQLSQIVVAAESDLGAGKIWRLDTRFVDEYITHADDVYKHLMPLGLQRGHNQAFGGPNIALLAQSNVPVVSLVQDGTNYFDYHHTANDTFDKLSLKDMQQNQAVYASFAFVVANSDMVFK